MKETQVTNDWLPDVLAEVRQQVAGSADDLLELSHQIHANPELRFQEEAAATRLTTYLAGQDFEVTKGIADLPTAFRAEKTFGTGTPTLAIFCEYDALPGIGHACGHNIIAAAGAGAGMAVGNWLAANNANGKLVVLGSPGEEGGGGKVKLVEAGELTDVAAAVMIHPAGFDAVSRTNLGRVSLEATFTGRASHAAAAPERGRNALDAATVLLVAIGLLRQQLQDGSRVHANVVDGGDSINVIPEHTKVSLFIRSTDATYLRGRLYEAVRDCVRGAALATGTTGELTEVAVAYEPVRTNPVMADLAQQIFTGIGRPIDPITGKSGPAGSTDMGNVSQVVPAIHPYVQVAPDLAIHTRDFAAAAATEQGDQAVLDGATVIGSVVAALFRDPDLVRAATEAFEERK
jgi:amidohydrolase